MYPLYDLGYRKFRSFYDRTFNLLRSSVSIATNYSISENYFKKEKIILSKETKHAKRLKISGLFFTTLGAVSTIATTPLVVIYHPLGVPGRLASSTIGGIGYSISISCLTIGIPMTVVGYKQARKLKEQETTPKQF
ncbi:MAG: hypothetical protein KDD21_11870 [Bacteroidetes bacterium]|nr:hypothetical protein [Bacteroidota bacterium]